MKRIILLTCLMALLQIASAEKPLKDYSFVRGVCYTGWMSDDEAQIKKELGYARRINLNSTRIWLSYNAYKRNPKGYIAKLKRYVQLAYDMGITTMPILWNGNGLNPATLEEDFWGDGDAYVKDVVSALKNEKGLFVWDIMNEPTCNDYHNAAPSQEIRKERRAKIFKFVRHYCELVKQLDKVNAITVGVTYASALEDASPDLVDVLAFHDYSTTRARIESGYKVAESIAQKYGKPLMNNEMGCIGRANPYDIAIEICESHKAGWYLFELMIGGYWGDIHGIFYPDGTIRDPNIVAAVMGCFKNRDLKTTVRENPNKENHVNNAIRQMEEALKENTETFRYRQASSDRILEAAEFCANLLESSQMVPMFELPTAKIETWRKQKPEERDLYEIKKFAYDLVKKLKECAMIM